jgi:hypothetical protein
MVMPSRAIPHCAGGDVRGGRQRRSAVGSESTPPAICHGSVSCPFVGGFESRLAIGVNSPSSEWRRARYYRAERYCARCELDVRPDGRHTGRTRTSQMETCLGYDLTDDHDQAGRYDESHQPARQIGHEDGLHTAR